MCLGAPNTPKEPTFASILEDLHNDRVDNQNKLKEMTAAAVEFMVDSK